jgi:hypothetical protein
MNQVADSRKKNLRPIVAKCLICLRGWYLSHIMQCGESEKRFNWRVNGLENDSLHALGALTFDPFALDPPEHPGQRLLQERHVLRDQQQAER